MGKVTHPRIQTSMPSYRRISNNSWICLDYFFIIVMLGMEPRMISWSIMTLSLATLLRLALLVHK